MMSFLEWTSEVSTCCKKNNGTTGFYSFPCDAETVFRKGQNTIHMLAKIGQRCISNLRNNNDATPTHKNIVE